MQPPLSLVLQRNGGREVREANRFTGLGAHITRGYAENTIDPVYFRLAHPLSVSRIKCTRVHAIKNK